MRKYIIGCVVLSALSVYFRDITHLYSVVILAWMYFTPIFYPTTIIPDHLSLLFKLNPLYHFIAFFRDPVVYGCMPSSATWLGCAVPGVVVFLLGFLIFRKLQKNFILYI